jgi:AcrR family transcriptional regulator
LLIFAPIFTFKQLVFLKNLILDKATEMFLTLGFKSVTMDDIASEISISKKTIYQHFADKTALVEAVSFDLFEKISTGIDNVCNLNNNPIEELFAVKNFVTQHLKDEKASPIFQLQKYYPKIHKTLMLKQFEKMQSCVVNNLQRGISLDLYRKSIDTDIISRLYFAGIQSIKHEELFPIHLFNPKELQTKYLEYHLRGICTSKGIETLEIVLQKT